jgi:ABC-type transport system substrate-binding protein
MTKTSVLVLACCCGVLFFAGCNKQSSISSVPAPASPISGAHVVRKVVNVGINADPGTLTPWANPGTGRTAVIQQIYEALAHRIGAEIIPVVMKTYKVADDGMSMDVTIYDYVYDTAGNHITSSDIKFDFDKARELSAIRAGAFIDRAEVIDDYTVRFYFNRELMIYDIEGFFESLLVISQKAYESSPDAMASTPISTGRYRVTQYTSGYILILEKNPSYWQKDESLIHARNQANAETINYYIITEPAQMTMALEQGSIDMSWAVSASDLYLFDEGGAQSSKYKVVRVADNVVMQFHQNQSEGKPTENADLRRAIYYAVNKEVILQSVYGGNGVVCYDTSRPACPDYNPAWETQDNYYHYNLEKAKSYLEKSGYKPNQLTLTLLVEGTETTSNMAVLIQSFLSQIGINVRISTVQPALMMSTARNPDSWDLYLQGSASSNYAPVGWAYIFDGAYYPWNGTISFSTDPKIQELLDLARFRSTHSQTTVDAFHNYVVDNALDMGLVNLTFAFVIPAWMDDMALSYQLVILPGGSTYTE